MGLSRLKQLSQLFDAAIPVAALASSRLIAKRGFGRGDKGDGYHQYEDEDIDLLVVHPVVHRR